MGVKDITHKQLQDYADVFADIVNVLLFDGEEKIHPSELMDVRTRSIYKADGKIHEQERDVAKYWEVNGIRIAMIGIENQTAIEREMPIRAFSYDAAAYRNQLKNRDDARRAKKEPPRLYPVITMVLYFGEKEWNQPLSMKEVLNIPDGFEKYVDDYRMNLFQIQHLSDEVVGKFKSDFRYVAELFTQMHKVRQGTKDKVELSPREIAHAKEVLELMTVVGEDQRFEDAYNQYVEKGDVDMFALFDIYEERGRKAGKIEGRQEEKRNSVKAIVRSLRAFTADTQEILSLIRQNQGYENVSETDVLEVLRDAQKEE